MLSDGRLELGIGAGWMTADYEQAGLRYDSAGRAHRAPERGDRRHQGLLRRRARSTSTASTTKSRSSTGSPSPCSSRVRRCVVGGGGPKVLRLAAREADIVGINPNLREGAVGPDAVKSSLADVTAQKVEWVREGAGDRFDDIELQVRYFLAAITDDAMAVAEMMAPGFGISPEEGLNSGVACVGTVDRGVRPARAPARRVGNVVRGVR